MFDISRARPHAVRIALVAVCLLTIFLFFDPIGFASSSIADHVPGKTNHVTHVVMFQFKRDADPAAVEAACAKMLALKDLCLTPNTNHAYIQRITGGKDNSPEGLQQGSTHAFIVQFTSSDDRNYYVEQDPAHQAFKKEIDPLVEKATVLDFTNGKFQ
ncbi:stress responsive A/B barrel domain-containing protein [Chaetomidium leptoderma]|uniref:Stress responsive A/B barrel domain-containing protein n=1 Tax=Chaetomidium leptoderma TaxID=669021 RepID=A0AAN6VI74_9PEZI|nr:stress responsive A/B barrel domain-containing protein [Chaetomidium leptoderma]